MGSRADKFEVVAFNAAGAEHNAQRQAHTLQHRSLLNVQFQIGRGLCQLLVRLRHLVNLDSAATQRIFHADAILIGAVAFNLWLHCAATGA